MSVQVENPASASVRGRWPLLALVVLALVLVGLLLVWLNLRGEQGFMPMATAAGRDRPKHRPPWSSAAPTLRG